MGRPWSLLCAVSGAGLCPAPSLWPPSDVRLFLSREHRGTAQVDSLGSPASAAACSLRENGTALGYQPLGGGWAPCHCPAGTASHVLEVGCLLLAKAPESPKVCSCVRQLGEGLRKMG